VALTFDDGPHPSLTPKALDILNRHGAKGTFFMLGQNATRYKSIVARAAAEGHELGVHTWSHIKMNSASRAKVDNEISRTQKTLAEVSGITPRVMRPPYGATNKALIDHMYNRYGMASIMWDVDTLDWRKPGVEKVINTAVNNARPGSIILVHDIHATTLAALEGIVTGLQARGFQLVTVSELMLLGKQEAAAKEAEETAAAAQTTDMPVQGEPSANVETPAAQPETPADPQQDMHAASDEEAVIQLDETNEI
jgi:peptidoglycan/xylan/chitin deacetylase (PgdA/CDA1 family)